MGPQRLEGKRILLTGGTRGIGKAMRETFIAHGGQVVFTGTNNATASEDSGFVAADSANLSDIEQAVSYAASRLGGIDVLVNNAGIEIEKTLEQTSEQDWDQIMDINVKAVFRYSRLVIPVMREAGGGAIINLGSISAFMSDPGLAAYNATKAAVVSLTRSIAVENGKDGVRCNAICPGWIDTDMLAQTFEQAGDIDAAREKINQMHPVGRLGQAQDIANMALWLASDESAFASGQTFTIDGGLTAGSPADPNQF